MHGNVWVVLTLFQKEDMRAGRELVEPDHLSDIVRRAQQLESAALEELVDRYSSRLYGFLNRLIGCRDDADELLQEVFVRVVRTISHYVEDGRFEAWLFRIATNLARDRLRRLKRSPISGSINDADPESENERSFRQRDASPRERLQQDEELDRMQEAVGRLPQAEREVVMLRFYGEFSFAEIAEMMETPLGTALARAHRGLAKLRQWMES